MHHYCMFTAPDFASDFVPIVSKALSVDLPRLALEHEFLLDALLLVSMVHLCCTNQTSPECLPIYLYRDQALRGLRQALADISSDNNDAVRGASILLAQMSFATDRFTKQPGLWIVNWMMLALGQRNFRPSGTWSGDSVDECVPRTFTYLPRSWLKYPATSAIPTALQRALDKETTRDNTQNYDSILREAAKELGGLFEILKSPYDEIELEKRIKAYAFDLMPPDLLRLIQERQPQALVIVAHYIIFFKFSRKDWMYQGLPDHDIEIIQAAIHPDWEEYLALPNMARHITDQAALAELLTSNLYTMERET
ncbi:hypothetical protein GQ53DRAFT_838396 [Thozetella sp. PMI_491]|nr:hypothetical protein GQ53DRAFT_838396 [Thozetella sp. PMI_491]